ncbi:hypothetical protein [Streptomyces pratensis]|uniref:hypothetical protein n=1 Tax=Streptomyces pratensis TaxID=1169025 RepID=UPI00193229E9|nr:hypothetical protein [Streptomyces pratensis]
MPAQPAAAREVARHLVELVPAPAPGMAPELAGPRVEQLVSLVRRLLRSRHERRLVVPVKLPGAAGSRHGGRRPAAG